MNPIAFEYIDPIKGKKEKVKFPCPDIDDLQLIQEAMWIAFNQAGKSMYVDIIFSGSVVMNLVGLMDQDVTDIDVIISTHEETSMDLIELEIHVQQALSIMPNFEYGRGAGESSGFDMLCAFTVDGKRVEVFTEQNRRYLTLTNHAEDAIKVSYIRDMFVKKWEYDPTKTNKHILDIETYLTVNEQK